MLHIDSEQITGMNWFDQKAGYTRNAREIKSKKSTRREKEKESFGTTAKEECLGPTPLLSC
jgi:hypothetical protein